MAYRVVVYLEKDGEEWVDKFEKGGKAYDQLQAEYTEGWLHIIQKYDDFRTPNKTSYPTHQVIKVEEGMET